MLNNLTCLLNIFLLKKNFYAEQTSDGIRIASSSNPTDTEIVEALRVLNAAGLTNIAKKVEKYGFKCLSIDSKDQGFSVYSIDKKINTTNENNFDDFNNNSIDNNNTTNHNNFKNENKYA